MNNTIKVSNSYITNMIKLLGVSKLEIFKKINELLYYEKIIPNPNMECEVIKEKFQGVVYENRVIYFASKLDDNGKIKSRNTYISQNFLSCFFISIKRNYKIYATINPFDFITNYYQNIYKLPDSIIFDIKMLYTLNVEISDLLLEKQHLTPFNSIFNFINDKKIIRSKNSGNKSTYIRLENNNILIYGKTDGANLKRTILEIVTMNAIKSFDIDNIIFIPLNKKISDKNIKDYLKSKKILIEYYFNELYENKTFLNNDVNQINRNQHLFYKNIILKYEKYIDVDKCFACNYNVSENLISSHIHRVVDIKKEFQDGKITKEKAMELIVSGDNGFLLCPNHDKEFEKGLIIFDQNEMEFLINDRYSYEYISGTLIKKYYSEHESIKTKDFILNINKHIDRVNEKNKI
ncbi:MAG: HNH endonuclease [Mycoplasma sp.]|nr:HNH endonuclease [Mycoplasma sp.]